MLAYMIYEKEEGEKNKRFIELFQREGVRFGISFLFLPKESYQEKELPDLVLNRTRDREVSLWYENRNVPVLHGSALVEIGNDKWKTYCHLREYFRKKKISFSLPDTVCFPEFTVEGLSQKIAKADWHRGENLVLKTVDGHGGREVFLFTAEELMRGSFTDDRKKVFQLLTGRKCVLQEQVDSQAMDVRVYVVGNEIYHGVLRQGKGDFRSNFSLGGSVREYFFSEEEEAVIRNCLEAFSDLTLGMVGLDFIVARDGMLVFNEMEEMVGSRMLYSCSKKDIVKDYVAWIGWSFLAV